MALHVLLLGFAGLYFSSFKSSHAASALNLALDKLGEYRYVLAFTITLVATLGSLFYSEIAGYDPCKLCWFQRVFMYPQVIILGIAWWLKDKSAWVYPLALSVVGLVVAGYHYVLQLWPSQVVNCSIVGQATSCSGTYVMQFGYITIPLMAATAFAVVMVTMFLRSD